MFYPMFLDNYGQICQNSNKFMECHAKMMRFNIT